MYTMHGKIEIKKELITQYIIEINPIIRNTFKS
jgi:hypothetical protein